MGGRAPTGKDRTGQCPCRVVLCTSGYLGLEMTRVHVYWLHWRGRGGDGMGIGLLDATCKEGAGNRGQMFGCTTREKAKP